MTRHWNIVGVCGHIEIIDGDRSGAFTPICKVHEYGDDQPAYSPPREAAWANAALICYAGNDLQSLVNAAKEAREALAACFRGAEKAGGYATETLLDEIAARGIRDGFGARLQEAIERADDALNLGSAPESPP